ncbi:MAG TPA: ATP-binding protein [Dongiaceae bacterium]|nr:ATP-binding protein [Dongiaceae bacterium]
MKTFAVKSLGLLPRLARKLEHLLDRLEPLLPPMPVPVDWSRVGAAFWRRDAHHAWLEAVTTTPANRLDDVLGVDRQKDQVVNNTRQFVKGLPANNVLLSGSRGTGKSSLIQALLNQFRDDGLRVIQVDKSDLADLLHIVAAVQREPYRFILFCDDLSFDDKDEAYKALKSALDGGVYSPPDNILIYATSNRRHLMPDYHADSEGSRVVDTEVHHAEAVEEKVSLSDRFGLWVTFYPINQDQYLAIAQHWLQQLAARHGLEHEWNDEVRLLCIRWAGNRGNRSGRTAHQFARHWIGQRLLTR